MVFLDVGGTLIDPQPSVGSIYADTAQRHGLDAKPAILEERFKTVWKARQGLRTLTAGGREAQKSWWKIFVKDMMTVVEGVDTWTSFDPFFDDLYAMFEQPGSWRVYPDVQETLIRLKECDAKLGVISNWDSRLLPLLDRLNLAHFFDTILVSGEVGVAKPNPKIFRKAAKLSGCMATECLHVGDEVEEDYQAAQVAGLSALLLDRKGEIRHAHSKAVIVSLGELPDLIYNR